MGITSQITLHGTLTCTSQEQIDRVCACIQTHIDLTRAESGCLSFEVSQSGDPMVWTVAECFVDQAAFEAHQTRTAASDWAAQTAGIERDYTVTGLK
ncbi:putative quinol monooxygenase [Sulfitobacter guttiformis]|uniref:Quinol monooxygenase YgiN n=1 Tax=Sulfitobacter guttiformis TaxID=74349 RepID=A0A420DI85_9RHOB|nr:antibiotic biosynthesis monooxygenase [Sulfitobacter guttiformis]KIN72313.1 Antibiotic biosynthesis monooxygenase [Sulfitobacter guttiformis KCTC 32187]RKE93924.1 quinol monooxygenase YgiN [Sulfitobacter guttiformis]